MHGNTRVQKKNSFAYKFMAYITVEIGEKLIYSLKEMNETNKKMEQSRIIF